MSQRVTSSIESQDQPGALMQRLVDGVKDRFDALKKTVISGIARRLHNLLMEYSAEARQEIIDTLQQHKNELLEAMIAYVIKRGIDNPELALITANFMLHNHAAYLEQANWYTPQATLFYMNFVNYATYDPNYGAQLTQTQGVNYDSKRS